MHLPVNHEAPRCTHVHPVFSVGVDVIHWYPFAFEINLKSTRPTEHGWQFHFVRVLVPHHFVLGRFATSRDRLR